MDYRTETWLFVIHLTIFIPAQTLGGGYMWRIPYKERLHDNMVEHRLVDVASPQRVTADASVINGASPRLKQYLRYTDRQEKPKEIRYNLTAFGKDYLLILKQEHSFLSAALTVEHYSSNQSISIPCGVNLSHCYYRGSVHGDPVSSAVFDLCYGLRGVFQTRDGVFLVQPLVQNTAAELLDHKPTEELRHLIVNHLATSQTSGSSHCGLDDENITESNHSSQHSLPKKLNITHSRRKRETIFQGAQSYPRYVEMVITVDKSMVDHYGSEFEVKRYIQTVVGVVHNIFRNPKLGNSIEIVLIGIKILKNDHDLKITSDAKTLLKRFCKWQHEQNVESDSDAGHYDTAVLITRKNICRSKGSCETLGLAELGTMCDTERSCSIVEDNGLGVAFTIAHELGHTFNIGHDVKAKKCLGETTGLHVMAPSLNLQSVPWSWSSCSRQAITDFLDQGHDKCLMDKPQYQFKRSERLPGQIYTPDMQCKLTFGKQSKLCSFKTRRPCRRLWCALPLSGRFERCRTMGMPWADGSECGAGMWCVRGSCEPKQAHIKINGGWSAWSHFGPCSRTCGGGVSYSSRACDNPKPSFGGEFCIGAKRRFKSCQTHFCPEGTPTFREVQCTAFNGKRGGPKSKWVPQRLYGRYQCQLVCEQEGGGDYITAKIIDGTKCDEKKFDICVNGICRLAGCDNILNSRKKLDECGVCDGDNSTCERITKTWYQGVKWGYNDVATLYPGYSSIVIEQTTPQTEARRRLINRDGDDNYLVLRDENYGNILNTGFFIKSVDKVVYEDVGLEITYSGSSGYPEYIKINGKLKQKIYLQVLAVEEVIAPRITYSYLSGVTYTFSWYNNGSWSRCSQECQGWRKRKLVCMRQDGQVVPSRHCDPRKTPGTIRQSCHTHCLFKWMVAGKGACKPGCGPGSQKVYYKCVKHEIEVGANFVRSSKDCRRISRPQSERPCKGTCDNVQWVYSKWSTCSKTCGGGTQTRKVICVEKINYVRKEMPSSMCSRIKTRHLQRTCNTDVCPIWRTTRWDRCSASCGEGFQRRKVSCFSKAKETQDSACDLKEKPIKEKACQMKACPHWEYDEWSDCSVSCGSGDKIRVVHCVDADGKGLTDKDCSAVKKPISRQKCTGLPDCDKTVFFNGNGKVKVNPKALKWIAGAWGECSAICGKGRQERHVNCVDSKNKVLDNNYCRNITAPTTIKKCFRYCGTWRYSDWTPCSSRCSKGTQRRQVKCFNKHYRLTEDSMCDPLLRPPKIRQCSNYLCAPPKKVKPKISGRWKTGSWTKCSKTCENGIKRRTVLCVNEHSRRDETEKSCKQTSKPESMISCNLGGCPQWRIKPWSKCSKTCDLGVVTRSVYCSDQKRILSDDKCNIKLKPTVKKSCYVKRCITPVRWAKGEWRPCSVKCGRGVKQRHVWCESYDRKRIPSTHCRSLKRRPKSVKECRRNTCGVWETGPWGTCSRKCDIGEQIRNVRCRKSSTFVDHDYCLRKNKPSDKKACRVTKCTSDPTRYKWFAAAWGHCSATCGPGVKSRMVICTNQNEQRASSSNCNSDLRPPDKTTCKNSECLPDWIVSDWSECSKSCDHGIQTRTVTCPEKDSRSVDVCDSAKKPFTKRRCNLALCGSRYVWKTGPWSQCLISCGETSIRRAVKCIDKNNHITSDYRCTQTRSIKPDDKKLCKLKPCLPKSCADIQKQFGKQNDKEFILTINGKKVKVYCYGMLTDEPKEYITLVSGPEKNFAEYYHRSLKNPNECPFNGERRDDCPQCHAEIFSSSGGTYFSKVRLDISRMSLIGNDLTFAKTRGNHSPAFGTAGDCYSKIHCPQGRFSVDLTSTGLSLSPNVSWQSYGYHLSKVVDIQKGRQIVSGMCGGYCGICRPYRSLRVVL